MTVSTRVRLTEDDLREVVTGYEASKNEAIRQRDAQLREFHARGWRPVDLQRVTGYSRETIRQALHPERRQAINTHRRKVAPATRRPTVTAPPNRPTATPPPGRPSYSERRPYAVADRLDELRGPTQGTVVLPSHLDWSGRADYDLAKPARLASMYRTVLTEAAGPDDLRAWIDGPTLRHLWPTLFLPPAVRRLWEGQFPELSARPPATL